MGFVLGLFQVAMQKGFIGMIKGSLRIVVVPVIATT